MSKFVAEMDVQINDHALYDHGAFYVDSTGIGRCVNGLARSFAVFLLREARADVFVDKPMLDQLKVVTNTSVKGFLVENVVITFIKLGGLVVDGYRLGAKGAGAKCITFARGSENQVIVSNSSSNIKETMETFFFPAQWNYPSVDAIYRGHWIDPAEKGTKTKAAIPEKQHFYICGVQITLQDPTAGQHAGSRDAFQKAMESWKRSPAEAPVFRYIWISPKEAPTINHPHNGNLPAIEEIFIKFSTVDTKLAFLDSSN